MNKTNKANFEFIDIETVELILKDLQKRAQGAHKKWILDLFNDSDEEQYYDNKTRFLTIDALFYNIWFKIMHK